MGRGHPCRYGRLVEVKGALARAGMVGIDLSDGGYVHVPRWARWIARAVPYLLGVPAHLPQVTAPRPVSWLAAMRSAAICVALGTASSAPSWFTMIGVRSSTAGSMGIGAGAGVLVSLAFVLHDRGSQSVSTPAKRTRPG